jgi:pyridoxamine 5'-phosphate oxidase
MPHRDPLDPAACDPDPMRQFTAWFADAGARGEQEPEACALATAGADGAPSLRMVLMRGHDARGFTFFTNYRSRKGRELDADPRAALTFYWPSADRQVRVEGRAERLTGAESDAYFARRSRDSQLGALASPQSEPVPDREALEARWRALRAEYAGRPVPRPAHWGGYRLVPARIEFWQSAAHRLHDRLLYTLERGVWRLARLAP